MLVNDYIKSQIAFNVFAIVLFAPDSETFAAYQMTELSYCKNNDE